MNKTSNAVTNDGHSAYDLVERYPDVKNFFVREGAPKVLDRLRKLRDSSKEEDEEKRKWDIKNILMSSIHYNLGYKKVVKELDRHPVLIPTLLEMIRERPHYRRVMARILVIFIYLEAKDYATLQEAIKDEAEKYGYTPLQNKRALVFINVLEAIHDPDNMNHSAADALNLYLSGLVSIDDEQGAKLVEGIFYDRE